MSNRRSREPEDNDSAARSPKRTKLSEEPIVVDLQDVEMNEASAPAENAEAITDEGPENLLPPSHALLGLPPPACTPDGSMVCVMESDVGISEYVGHDVPKIEGIIKQRYV